MNLLPESPDVWDMADQPASAPAAIPRPGKPCLARVANTLALAAVPISGLAASAVGTDWTSAVLQAGITGILALGFLRPFAHLAAQALARH
jgi:hypothetical protein